MPLVRIDLIQGRNPEELKRLSDTLHQVIVEAFNLPERDRFQIITEHRPDQMIIQDVGLGFERSEKIVFLQVTTTPRPLVARKAFYKLATERLEAICGISPQDVVINLVTASESDWSFGDGNPQFLTGEL